MQVKLDCLVVYWLILSLPSHFTILHYRTSSRPKSLRKSWWMLPRADPNGAASLRSQEKRQRIKSGISSCIITMIMRTMWKGASTQKKINAVVGVWVLLFLSNFTLSWTRSRPTVSHTSSPGRLMEDVSSSTNRRNSWITSCRIIVSSARVIVGTAREYSLIQMILLLFQSAKVSSQASKDNSIYTAFAV